MNIIDAVLGLILVTAFFMGYRKGFLIVLTSLVGLVAGVYCAMFFSHYIQDYLIKWFDWGSDLNRWVAFFATLFLVLIVFSIAGRVLTGAVNVLFLGFFNKLLGGIFNVFKYAFLISVIFLLVNTSEHYRILTPEKREQSILYGIVAGIAPRLLPTLEEQLEQLDLDPVIEFDVTQPKDSLP